VRIAGSASWCLEVSDSELAELALFVRDAVGLGVPTSVDLPPRLDRPVPDRRGMLSDRDSADASEQWMRWWRRIIGFEFGVKRSLGTLPAGQRAFELSAAFQTVSDPPEFMALADVPLLRAAIRASFGDAVRWQQGRTVDFGDVLGWALTKRAVDDVAFDRQVRVDTLDGALLVLPVSGLWWRRIAPGQLLCSEAAARSPQTNYEILYEVFASGLDR
jgi:hypothetical protein